MKAFTDALNAVAEAGQLNGARSGRTPWRAPVERPDQVGPEIPRKIHPPRSAPRRVPYANPGLRFAVPCVPRSGTPSIEIYLLRISAPPLSRLKSALVSTV